MSAPLIPVMLRKATGFPKKQHPDPIDRAVYVPIDEVLAFEFPDDHHFSAYSVPSIGRRLGSDKGEIWNAVEKIPMVTLVVDVDGPSHTRSKRWDASETKKIEKLFARHPGFAYFSRGGYRLVWQLAEPRVLRSADDARRWAGQYRGWLAYLKNEFKIDGDPSCSNWNCLFRLPFVVRDGESERHPTIGDPAQLGSWDVEAPLLAPSSKRSRGGTPTPYTGGTPVTETGYLKHIWHELVRRGPSIKYQRGNDHAFTIACVLVNDHDLPRDIAAQLFQGWRDYYSPTTYWSDDSLDRLLSNAAEYASDARGMGRIAYGWVKEITNGVAR